MVDSWLGSLPAEALDLRHVAGSNICRDPTFVENASYVWLFVFSYTEMSAIKKVLNCFSF